jgi:hypothetical protein
MMTGKLMGQRLLALFAAGVLLFSYPLLKLWLAPLALFGAWALLIVVLALLLEQGDH